MQPFHKFEIQKKWGMLRVMLLAAHCTRLVPDNRIPDDTISNIFFGTLLILSILLLLQKVMYTMPTARNTQAASSRPASVP